LGSEGRRRSKPRTENPRVPNSDLILYNQKNAFKLPILHSGSKPGHKRRDAVKRIALLPVLLLMVAVPALADTQNYFDLKLGAYLPQANDVKDFDSSFYGELGFGYYFTRNFAVEIGVGYTKPGASVSANGSSASVDITVIPATLGLRGSIPVGAFEPFATAGVGVYFTRAEASLSSPAGGSGSKNDDVVGYYLGLGSNFNVSPNVFLGVEGKYFWAKPSFEGVDIKIDGINLTANIGYRF
jgi:outer membrane protein W